MQVGVAKYVNSVSKPGMTTGMQTGRHTDRHVWTPLNAEWTKKLSCRRETAGCFLSLDILLSHSSSSEMTPMSRVCGSPFIHQYVVGNNKISISFNYVYISYRLWDIQRQIME